MPEKDCSEERRFENIEMAIDEIKEVLKIHNSEISALKEGHIETKVYVKQILERIEDLKALFNSVTGKTDEKWVSIIKELIKAIITVGGIIAGIKLIN